MEVVPKKTTMKVLSVLFNHLFGKEAQPQTPELIDMESLHQHNSMEGDEFMDDFMTMEDEDHEQPE